MGGSSKQVTGYKYFANFLLFIGNPIERLIAINFDKRGWEQGKRVPYGSNGEQITIDAPNMYGENEGGVSGLVYLKTGTDTQTPVEFYQDYLESVSLPPLAYPFQSYLAFKDFYLGNSGYMKEMLLWPQRIHVKNDGSAQWYNTKAKIGEISDFGGAGSFGAAKFSHYRIGDTTYTNHIISYGDSLTPAQTIFVHYVLDMPAGNYEVDLRIGFASRTGDIFFPQQGGSDPLISVTTLEHLPASDSFGESHILRIKTNKPGVNSISIQLSWGGEIIADNWWVVGVEKLNEKSAPATSAGYYQNGLDINPIHKIREILTDDTAMNKPESEVNDANFMKAADRIFDEGLGISWAITEKSCIEAINELCSHVEAGIRVNRQTGLYEMVLFRDDWFEEDEIHSLAENKIKSFSFEVQNTDDVVNQINVSHYDRENIKDASFSIAENASIKNMQGRVNAETADFPYFMNQRNAAVVTQWKLKQFTTPCWKGTFTTGYSEARKWNRYDIVRINWSRKNIVDLPVRIMSIHLGDGVDNTVSIDFVEVVPFSDELTSIVVIDDKIDTAPLPPQPVVFKAFELPYLEAVQSQGQRSVDDELAYDSDIGYVAVVAQRPQNNSLNAQMHTDAGTGYENSAVIQYCETAKLDQAVDRESSSFILKNVGDIDSVRVGSQIFINDETMVYQSFDAVTKLLIVKRGALDTVPQVHAADSILFFADDFVAADQDQYMDGEIINVKVVTTTPSGVLDLNNVVAQSVEIQSRAIRPYPPANVKINDAFMPVYFEDDFSLTWANRNRSQQTGGTPLGYFEASVTLEENTQTLLTVIELDATDVEIATHSVNVTASNSFTLLKSAMQADTHSLSINLKTVRDGYECLNIFNHTVQRSTLIAPSNVAFEVIEY